MVLDYLPAFHEQCSRLDGVCISSIYYDINVAIVYPAMMVVLLDEIFGIIHTVIRINSE